jgi:hypothetical protein
MPLPLHKKSDIFFSPTPNLGFFNGRQRKGKHTSNLAYRTHIGVGSVYSVGTNNWPNYRTFIVRPGLTCSTLLPQEHPSMASFSKAQGEPSQAPASDLHADMHALVENEYKTNDTPPTELKRAASLGGDSTTKPKRPKPTSAGPEKNPTGPPNPTPPAAAEAAASPNLTPPGPKINPRAPPGGLLATEFMANLQKTVDTMARAACARSSKYLVFTETVREQIKEVGKSAGGIYDHMEWLDKAHTNSVATLNLLHTVQHWSTAIHDELSGVSRQLTNLSDMLKQVLDCMRTFSEAPPPLPTKPRPPTGTPLCGATRPVHPPTPTPWPRSTPTIPEPDLPRFPP